MPFEELLERLLAALPSAPGAILFDREGEAVVQAGRMDAYDLQVAGAHLGVIVHHLRTATANCGGGRLDELFIAGAAGRALVLPVTDDYCLALVLDRDGLPGPARFAAHRCVIRLQQELACP